MNEGNGAMNRFAIRDLDVPQRGHVLEIGMGNGCFVQEIIARAEGVRYTGVDYSEVMIEEAVGLNSGIVENESASFVHADVFDLPFAADTFDNVLCVNTLYFWEPVEAALAEVRRVLRPGGQLVVGIRPKRVMQHYPFVKHGFRMFSGEELGDLLRACGFDVEAMTAHDEPPQDLDGTVLALASLIVRARLQTGDDRTGRPA